MPRVVAGRKPSELFDGASSERNYGQLRQIRMSARPQHREGSNNRLRVHDDESEANVLGSPISHKMGSISNTHKKQAIKVQRSPAPSGNHHHKMGSVDPRNDTMSAKNFTVLKAGEKTRLRNARTFIDEDTGQSASGSRPQELGRGGGGSRRSTQFQHNRSILSNQEPQNTLGVTSDVQLASQSCIVPSKTEKTHGYS